MLPIAIEEATKALQAILEGGKEYVCVMKLHGDVPEEKVRRAFEEFTGQIYQRPPLRSSVKREVRVRTIYYNRVLEVRGRRVLFEVACQSGTYIRKLCHDIGEALGVGAHMAELRRRRAGPFSEDEGLVRLHDLADAVAYWRELGEEGPLRRAVMPVEKAVELLPKVYVKDTAIEALCRGAYLTAPGVSRLSSRIRPGDLIAIMSLKGELVALARALVSAEAMLEAERGMVAKVERVVMKPGTYPKAW